MSRRARSSQSPRGGVSQLVLDTADIVRDGVNRWGEKAGLRWDAVSLPVIDALEAQRQRRPAM